MHEAWYMDGATVVAFIALVFSVASWWLGNRHTKVQEQVSAHVDLRSVLQRLLTVPRDGQDMKVTYKDDALAYQVAYSTLQQELTVLASQGAKAVEMLKPGIVSSPEYLVIGRAQLDAADYAGYKRYIGLACESAKAPRDKVLAQAEMAAALFQEGKVEDGRKGFRAALENIKDYPPFTPGSAVKLSVTDDFQVKLQWAEFERSVGQNGQGALEIVTGLRDMVQALAKSAQHDAMAGVVANFLSVAAREIFESGDVAGGRAEFAAALQLGDGLTGPDAAVPFGVTMHLSWMDVESELKGNEAVVEEQLNQAIELVKNRPGTPEYNQVAGVSDAWAKFKGESAGQAGTPAAV
jgi:hypothetical protein